jgi:hypothetical protein
MITYDALASSLKIYKILLFGGCNTMFTKRISLKAFCVFAAIAMMLTTALPAFAQENIAEDGRDDLGGNETLITEFVESVGDWEQWMSYYTPSAQEMYESFIGDESNRDNNVGILTVNSASVVSIERINNIYAPKFFELAEFYESENDYETYLVGMDMSVNQETEYFYNGVNYKIIVLVNNEGTWEIGGHSGTPAEVLVESNGVGINEAIEKFSERVHGTAATRGVGYGLLDPGTTPTSIKVYYNGTVYNPTFSTFVKNATSNEIGNMGYDAEAVKANVLAVKMCGWWCKVGQYRDSYGADIMYGDVAYVPNTTIASSVTSAYNSVGSVRCVSSSGSGSKLFYTAYFAGDYDDDGEGSGELRQNGSDYLATEWGYDYDDILHFYYDDSDYNNPNVGTVRIY